MALTGPANATQEPTSGDQGSRETKGRRRRLAAERDVGEADVKRETLEQAVDVVRDVVLAWRPCAWADVDEWHREVRAVARQVPRIASPRDAAHAIARVFSSSLSDKRFAPESCLDVGERLFRQLVVAGLVVASEA